MKTHGLAATYVNGGCRCEACTAANTERVMRKRRERGERAVPPGIAHGAAVYVNWGCRCDICTPAHTELGKPHSRAWRSRAQAETAAQAARSGRRWTASELDLISRPGLTAKQAAVMTGRTLLAVRAMKLKVARTAAASDD